MQFALNDNGDKVKPTFSGQRAKCPFCNGTVIAKCGDIYIHHWQHNHDRECDPWQEHETEWHRQWKAKFPESCQEVTIENNGEKHRADVRTQDGLVIEFQNSSISTTTISIREAFYEDMIWVVNANSFKENFHLQSIVKTRLRELEEETKFDASTYTNEYNTDLKEMDDEIKEKNEDAKSIVLNKGWKQKTLDRIVETNDALEEFAERAIGAWLNQTYFWESDTSDILNQVSIQLREELKSIPKKREQLITEQKGKQNLLHEIANYEDVLIEDTRFKIIPYERMAKTSFGIVKAISKESRKTFFPEIISFKTEYEFEQYKYRKSKFDFAFDPTNTIKLLETRILETKDGLLTLEAKLGKLKVEVKSELQNLFEQKIIALKKEIEVMDAEVEQITKTISYLEERKAHSVYLREKDRDEYMVQLEKEKTEKRFKIMKEKKGLYWFDWKHKRKSWQVANTPLYFDIGKDYLFKKVSDKLFRKVMISDFLHEHLTNKS